MKMIVESMFLKKFTLYILKECWEKRLRDERKKSFGTFLEKIIQ